MNSTRYSMAIAAALPRRRFDPPRCRETLELMGSCKAGFQLGSASVDARYHHSPTGKARRRRTKSLYRETCARFIRAKAARHPNPVPGGYPSQLSAAKGRDGTRGDVDSPHSAKL